MATAGDIREIMEIPQEGPPKPAPKKIKADPGPRLTGFQREVQSLMSDSHNVPPIPIVDNTRYKAKPSYAPRAFKTRKWQERRFVNGARTDGLELRHWKHAVLPPAGQRFLGYSSNGLNVMPDGKGLTTSETARGNEENVNTQATAPIRYDDEFPMEKFNVKASVPTYTSEQYATHFKSEDWTKEETDYLMNLCRDFDLRWIVVADRYDESEIPISTEKTTAMSLKDENMGQAKGEALRDAMVIDQNPGHANSPTPDDDDDNNNNSSSSSYYPSTTDGTKPRYPKRSLESLKSRYYTIASKMLSITTPPDTMTPSEFALWEKMKNFDARTEELRKNLAEKLFMRTKEEADEERVLLEELARITKNEEEFLKMRKDLYQRLETPILSRRGEDQGTAAIYQTSSGLGALLSNLLNREKRFKRPGMIDTSRANSGQDADGEAERGTAGTATDRPRKQTWEKGQHPNQYTARRNTMDAESANGDVPKKTGSMSQTPNMRTISPAEEAKYGVAHPPERITSGVQFRHEKASKVVLSKSAAQMAKIQAALVELGIPVRLLMPTEKVCREYERLVADIVLLLDARRGVERVGSEVRVLEESRRLRLGLPKEETGNVVEKMEVDKEGDIAQEGIEESGGTARNEDNAEADAEGDADEDANGEAAANDDEDDKEARVEAGARKEGSALDAEEDDEDEEHGETGENEEDAEAEEDINAEEDKPRNEREEDEEDEEDDEDEDADEAEVEAEAQDEDDEEDELAASPESEDEGSAGENDDDNDDDAEQDGDGTGHRAADAAEEEAEAEAEAEVEAEPEGKSQPAAVPARLHKRSASVVSDGSRAGSNRSGVSRKKGRR
jgi:DNA methyltransferase 1-associated protein 1